MTRNKFKRKGYININIIIIIIRISSPTLGPSIAITLLYQLIGVVIIYGILSFFLWAFLFFRCSLSWSQSSVTSVGDVFIFLHYTLLLVQFCACGPICICWKYFAMALVCVLCCGRLVSLLVTWGVSSASKILLLLHISTPLPVHRMRMHSDLNGGSIAEVFRLSTIRIGCLFSQSWMMGEYVL